MMALIARRYIRKGDGTFEQGAKYRVKDISSLAAIDLNGDSNLDIVTINPKRVNPNTLFVFFNQGNGRFRGERRRSEGEAR